MFVKVDLGVVFKTFCGSCRISDSFPRVLLKLIEWITRYFTNTHTGKNITASCQMQSDDESLCWHSFCHFFLITRFTECRICEVFHVENIKKHGPPLITTASLNYWCFRGLQQHIVSFSAKHKHRPRAPYNYQHIVHGAGKCSV